jgi:chitodextrinase
VRTAKRAVELCLRAVFFLLPFFLILQGCGGNGSSTTPNPVSVSVSPLSASVAPGNNQQFAATVLNAANTSVTWQVNGATGGDTTHGMISSTGMFTAPASVPSPATVTVSAISQADPTKSASVTVTISSSSSDSTAPSTPSSLTATAVSSTQISLVWVASTDNVGVAGYRIERCSGASCSSFAQIATSTTTSFTNTGLTASTSYSYRVRATDAAGNLSGYSNTASATTQASSDNTAPTAPSNLVATASSSSQIGLTWAASTDNVGVTGYRIERCSGASCSSFAQIGTTGGVTTFSDSGLTASTPYSYRVRATDAAGNLGSYSNTASATTSSSGGSSITVSISPKRGGLTTSQTLSVAATLTNDAANQGVTWSSSGGGSFSLPTSTSGVPVTFTAPSSAGVITITATSVANNSASASATIGVTDLAGVLTYHNNLSRDGTNTREYALTPSNVTTSTFGKLFSCAVDAAIYAQPLWIPKVSVGGGIHNVVLVATMKDSVYLFDADISPCVTYWHKQLIPSGETYGHYTDLGSSDIFPDIGILGTPVIDPSTATIYLVSKTKTTSGGTTYIQRLHALSLTDGSERANSPVAIDSSITVPGTCEGGSSIAFNAQTQNQRPGLALVGGTLYIAWASHGDSDPYHGWVISFNSSTLARINAWNATPNKLGSTPYCRGGIWMSGGAPAVDSSNNVYVMTGNGVFDAGGGGSNYGSSYIKLTSSLGVSDYFTPHDQLNLDGNDTDVGSGGTALLIDQTSGPVSHLMVGAGKSGTFYLLNRDNMGHFNASSDSAAVQTWTASGRSFSTPAFWNNKMYYFGVIFGSTVPGQQYTFTPSTGQFSTTPTASTPTGFGFPGATPSVSANGTSNAIVWAIDSSEYGTRNSGVATATAAILHAYDGSNIGTELWNSGQGLGNSAGNAVKFTVPTVANGKVYIGTRGNDNTSGSGTVFGELDVYGLLPN